MIKGAEGQRSDDDNLVEPADGRDHNAPSVEFRRSLQSLQKDKVLYGKASLVKMACRGPTLLLQRISV